MVPILETPRLRLRPPAPTDFEAIYRLGNNPRVMRYISGKTQSRREAQADLNRRIQASKGDAGYWITEHNISGEFLGWMALKPLEGYPPHTEIGYRFLEEAWGNGYATEGGFCLLHYAFGTLQLKEVVAVAMEANKASRRVMEKLGLHFDHKGIYYDVECVFYRISREQFFQHVDS